MPPNDNMGPNNYSKKHLKNVGPIRHCEPPHAHSPGVATGTVARRLRIDVHDDNNNDNAWQRGPLWPHRMDPISNDWLTGDHWSDRSVDRINVRREHARHAVHSIHDRAPAWLLQRTVTAARRRHLASPPTQTCQPYTADSCTDK